MAAPAAGYGTGNSVEVRTSTLTSTGKTLLPPSFAQAMHGSTYKGAQIGACARVNWGPPAVADVFALGISECDWKRMTGNNTTYYGPVGSLLDQVGLFNLIGMPSAGAGVDGAIPEAAAIGLFGNPVTTCTTPASATVPRGYVWLGYPDGTAADANCKLHGLQVGDKPRSVLLAGLFATNCTNKLKTFRGSTLMVPIYDSISRELLTVNPAYRIVGFAPFVVTGYGGGVSGLLGSVGSLITGSALFSVLNSTLCSLLGACIYGYFTRTVLPERNPQFGTGKDYGATIIGRTG